MQVIVYLCEEHAGRVLNKAPMTDDTVICQVPTCFRLATWKYFTEVVEQVPKNEAVKNPPELRKQSALLTTLNESHAVP